MMPTQSPLRISSQAWLALLALGVALWLLITYSKLIAGVSGLVFASFLITLAIRPAVNFAGRWHIPRVVTALFIYLIALGTIVALGRLILPVIVSEVSSLRATGPTLAKEIAARINSSAWLGQWLPTTDQLAQNLSQRLDMLIVTALEAATDIGGFAIDLVIVLILALFFTTDQELGKAAQAGLTPVHHRQRVRAVLSTLHDRLTYWIWAQIAIGIYFAVVFSVGLSIIGVPFALSIGLVGGFIEVVPYLGGLIALVLACTSALTVDPIRVIWVILFYLVVVEIESHVLAPILYGRVTGLHPAIVLIALLVGLKVWGVVGVLFAVPIAVIVAVVVTETRQGWEEDAESDTVADTGQQG